MTGDAFLAQARHVRPDAVRMLFTGYADIQAVINAVNEGRIFRYILKPWDPTELEGVIKQAAEQYELLAERKRLIDQLQEANAQLTGRTSELAEANTLKGAFIEVASHEFNTPITLVLGLSELLQAAQPRPRTSRARGRRADRRQRPTARPARGQHPHPDEGRRLPPDPPPSRSTSLADLLRDVAGRVEPFVAARQQDLDLQTRRRPRRLRGRPGQDRRRGAQPPDQRDQVHPRRRRGSRLSARLASPDEAEIEVEDRGIGSSPGPSGRCSSRSSPSSTPAAIPRATSASRSAGWAWA